MTQPVRGGLRPRHRRGHPDRAACGPRRLRRYHLGRPRLHHADLGSPPTRLQPRPATGRAPVDVGSPGRNDHTIDAGFHTTGAFQIKKLTEGGTPAPGQTFTFDVTAATNFRGDDVLDTINPKTFTIRAGEIAPAVPQQLPVGTKITIQERGGDPSYEPGATQVITVNDGNPLRFTVTNQVPKPSTPKIRTVASAVRVEPGKPFRDKIHVSGLAARPRGHRRRAAVRAVRIPRWTPPATRPIWFGRRRCTSATARPAPTRSRSTHPASTRGRSPSTPTQRPSATHPCGQVAETTTVAKRDYVAPVIDRRILRHHHLPQLRPPRARRHHPDASHRPPRARHPRARHRRKHDPARQRRRCRMATEVRRHRRQDRHRRHRRTCLRPARQPRCHVPPEAGPRWPADHGHAGRDVVPVQGRQQGNLRPPPQLPHRYFVTTGGHRLVLISCTDRVVYHNGHFHYTRYIVVVANEILHHR